jgi:hypothetical protein
MVHVWTCTHQDASQLWQDSLQHLRTWLEDQHSDPDLIDTILGHLDNWCNSNPSTPSTTHDMNFSILGQNGFMHQKNNIITDAIQYQLHQKIAKPYQALRHHHSKGYRHSQLALMAAKS